MSRLAHDIVEELLASSAKHFIEELEGLPLITPPHPDSRYKAPSSSHKKVKGAYVCPLGDHLWMTLTRHY